MKRKAKVQFWMEPDGFGCMAYFPDMDWGKDGDYTKTCYAHIGQHSACVPDYLNECRPATPEEYRDLKKELEDIGYHLRVMRSEYPVIA